MSCVRLGAARVAPPSDPGPPYFPPSPAPGSPTRPPQCGPLASLPTRAQQSRMKQATSALANTGKTLTCRRTDLWILFPSHCPQRKEVPGWNPRQQQTLVGVTTSGTSHAPGPSHTQGSALGLEATPSSGPASSEFHPGLVSLRPRTRLLRTHFGLLRLNPTPLYPLSLGSEQLGGRGRPRVLAFYINTCINKFVL